MEQAAERRLQIYLQDKRINRTLLSHRIRKMQVDDTRTEGGPVVIYIADLSIYVDQRAPNPQEQADNLILWIGTQQDGRPESWASSRIEPLAAIVGAAVSPDVGNEPGFQWLQHQYQVVKYQRSDLFDTDLNKVPSQLSFRLTMKGWSLYEELRRRVVDSKKAFMAMKFNDITMDNMLQSCFKPAAARTGFVLFALNDGQPAGLIDNQIRAAIRTARFVIADLTHDNNGAYFEAGFAEGLGMPVIYTCENGKFREKKTHFDTNHMVTVPWTETEPEIAARLLTATIRATVPGEAKLED
jgi:hypothetical protein